jgi:hypothetical protein
MPGIGLGIVHISGIISKLPLQYTPASYKKFAAWFKQLEIAINLSKELQTCPPA